MNQELEQLQRASEGLHYLSEGDYPFQVFSIPKPDVSLEESLLELSGKPPGTKVEKVTLEHFFRNQGNYYTEAVPGQEAPAQRISKLVELLKNNLFDIAVYRVGEIQVEAFIVGQGSDGSYGGLRTRVIET